MRIIYIALLILASQSLKAQENFDIIQFTAPNGWQKQKADNAVQLSKQDDAKGTYCLFTIVKSIPGTGNSKEDFEAAWGTVVKEMVKVSGNPDMQPIVKEDGWEVQTGYSIFELDSSKGIVMLVTSSGYQKMVNIVVLTNTDAYEKDITDFLGSVSLTKPTPAANKTTTEPVKTVNANTVAKSDGFVFNTTNFDDGWTSTVQEDWVEVKKDAIKVFIHYPKAGTIFPADPEPLTNAAWNILVAPRYSNLKNYKTTYITTYDRPYLGFGTATENATGREVYIVLFRQGQTGWLEFVSPNKNSFIQYFKFDPDNIKWDSETELMKPLSLMATYNKFAIGSSDFTGTWTSDFTGVQQLYNVYTGSYAGMNIHQSNQTFQFGAGNSYNWSLLAINGTVGNTKYVTVKSSGKFSVVNNWQISFSDIEGRQKKYHAYFACIKGARLLMLLDAGSPGSGIYDMYGKK